VKAFQFVEWQRPGELRDVPVPEPGPGQVLIKVGGAGACHSDLYLMDLPADKGAFRLPFTLGHENAGWVHELGPGVTGFTAGDPVIVY
jgi:alcohol dehydrogenase, propanol-preferring